METNASNRTTAFKLLDKLIKELNEICQKAEKEGSLGLVNLQSILNYALDLQKVMAKDKSKVLDLKSFSEAVFFLIQMAKKIHSIFFNCFRKYFFKNAIWKNHKTFTHLR